MSSTSAVGERFKKGAIGDSAAEERKYHSDNENVPDSKPALKKSGSLVVPARQAKVSFSPEISINVSSPEDRSTGVNMHCQFTSPMHYSHNKYKVVLIGESTLDRRFTSHMLPWVIIEVIRKKSICSEVILQLTETSLKASIPVDDEVLFEHKLKNICKFSKTHHDHSCFMYLTRESPEEPFRCFVYQAESEQIVSSFFCFDWISEMDKAY